MTPMKTKIAGFVLAIIITNCAYLAANNGKDIALIQLLIANLIGLIFGLFVNTIFYQFAFQKKWDLFFWSIARFTVVGLIVTFLVPHVFCYFADLFLGDDYHFPMWAMGWEIRMAFLKFFVPACALGGALSGWKKKGVNGLSTE